MPTPAPTSAQVNAATAAVAAGLSPQERGLAPDIPAEFVTGTPTPGASLTICSIYPMDLESRAMPHGNAMRTYRIPAGSLEKPSYLKVYNTFTMILGMSMGDEAPPMEPRQIRAQDICKDLLQAWGGDHPATRAGFIGVFVCKGEKATPEELANAKAKQEAYFRRIVGDVTAAWADPRRRNNLSLEEGRRALDWLGEKDPRKYEWYKPEVRFESKDCPACAEPINTEAHICVRCHTNVAVYMRDRGMVVEAGSWPGVERELKFLAQATAKAAGVGAPTPAAGQAGQAGQTK